MENFKPTKYTLSCVATGREFDDAGWILDDAECKTPSLVRANYEKKQIEVKPDISLTFNRYRVKQIVIQFKSIKFRFLFLY